MFEWLRAQPLLLWWMGAVSVALFAAGLVGVPLLVARIPADYFVRIRPPPDSWADRHPLLRFGAGLGRNLLAALLVLAGVTMLVLPGQGVLTILMGLGLAGFPGKRKLELWIVRRRAVLRAIRWIRARAKRPPLQIPDPKPIQGRDGPTCTPRTGRGCGGRG
ncbi:MAG: PGPGW domain-containing protein [Planctomycetota bacterium]